MGSPVRKILYFLGIITELQNMSKASFPKQISHLQFFKKSPYLKKKKKGPILSSRMLVCVCLNLLTVDLLPEISIKNT